MALAYTYAYRASECPAPQEPLSPLYKGSDPPTPVSADSLSAGGTTLVTPFNRNAVRLDLAHRYGGCYGINWGLDLHEGSGLTARVLVGQATLDGIAEIKNDAGYTTLAVTDNLVNRAWLSRGSSLNKVTSDSASPLDPPDGVTLWHYLGAFVVSGGTVVALDRSGVLTKYQGNLLVRRTADAGEPDDEPPASIRFYTQTQGGWYLWTGEAYIRVDNDQSDLLASLTATQDDVTDLRRIVDALLLGLAQRRLGPDLLADPVLKTAFRQALSSR